MGRVYRAYDRRLRRNVALKVLSPGAGPQAQLGQRLLREARAAAAFDHPHAVQVFDVGLVGSELFIAMELVVGHPLRTYVGRADVAASRKIAWMMQVARALSAAHRAGLVHRDIKPDNIMVRADDDAVKVLDFGIARHGGDDDDEPDWDDAPTWDVLTTDPYAMTAVVGRLTAAGAILGTPAYMAPEQVAGLPVDGRADQHAWAITTFELFVGDVPWPDGTLADVVRAVMGQPVEVVPSPEVSAALAQVLRRATQKDPHLRYPTMDALLDAYAAASRPAPRSTTFKWRAPAAAAVAAAALVGGIFVYRGKQATEPFAAPRRAVRAPVPSEPPSEVEPSPPSPTWVKQRAEEARRLAYAERVDEARARYDDCLAAAPMAIPCLAGRIELNQDAGQCDAVAEDALTIINEDPAHPDAPRYLAEARFALGHPRAHVEEKLAESHRRRNGPTRARLVALDAARLAILDGDFGSAQAELARARAAPIPAVETGAAEDRRLAAEALMLEVGLRMEMGAPSASSLARSALERAWVTTGTDDAALRTDPTVRLLRASMMDGHRNRDTFEADRDAYVAAWNQRVDGDVKRHVWLHLYAAPTRDEEDAQDALDVADRYAPRPRHHPGVPGDAWMGRIDAWSGHYDRAVAHLDRAVRSCEAISFPLEHVQAAMALGRSHEGAGRPRQACRAYLMASKRWKDASPSLTANAVRKRLTALGCDQ